MVVAPVTDLSATTSDFMENLHRVKNSVCFYVSVTFVCDVFFKERFILLHISEPSGFCLLLQNMHSRSFINALCLKKLE